MNQRELATQRLEDASDTEQNTAPSTDNGRDNGTPPNNISKEPFIRCLDTLKQGFEQDRKELEHEYTSDALRNFAERYTIAANDFSRKINSPGENTHYAELIKTEASLIVAKQILDSIYDLASLFDESRNKPLDNIFVIANKHMTKILNEIAQCLDVYTRAVEANKI